MAQMTSQTIYDQILLTYVHIYVKNIIFFFLIHIVSQNIQSFSVLCTVVLALD